MTEARRAVDSVAAFREGVEQFCEKHKEEIMAYIALQYAADVRMAAAELIAIRGEKPCT